MSHDLLMKERLHKQYVDFIKGYKRKYFLYTLNNLLSHLTGYRLLKERYKGLPQRDAMRFIHKHFGEKELIGVEIGVQVGMNALNILKKMNIKKLYLIDIWAEFTDDYCNYSDEIGEISYQATKKRIRRYKDKVELIRKKSSDAVNDVPDNLDFVYIDGNHAYNFVKDDIEKYYTKVKIGGILAGNDFEYSHEGVTKAVIEFVNKEKLHLYTGLEDGDWWVIKPNEQTAI